MFDLFFTSGYAVFAVAFVVMLGIGAIEAIGLGLGHFDLNPDLEISAESGGLGSAGVLDWLGLKSGLPILIWLTSLLACFTIAGVAVQQIATAVVGGPLHWSIASIIALVIGGCANGFAAAGLARVMPEYESSIIDAADLVRRRGTILEGSARRGHPARAKVIDQHGQAHYVMVEPHHDDDVIGPGEIALLVRRDGLLFFGQPDESAPFRSI